jgi:hypothetical protein
MYKQILSSLKSIPLKSSNWSQPIIAVKPPANQRLKAADIWPYKANDNHNHVVSVTFFSLTINVACIWMPWDIPNHLGCNAAHPLIFLLGWTLLDLTYFRFSFNNPKDKCFLQREMASIGCDKRKNGSLDRRDRSEKSQELYPFLWMRQE